MLYYNHRRGKPFGKEGNKMRKNQIAAAEAMKEYFGNRRFTEQEWGAAGTPACGVLNIYTAEKAGYVVRRTETWREYYTVAEIVAMLNECSGEDCYCGRWYYQIDEQGRIFEENGRTWWEMT